MESANNVGLAVLSVVIILLILVKSVRQVIFFKINGSAKAVKDFVLHAQKLMFVRVAIQVDFSL